MTVHSTDGLASGLGDFRLHRVLPEFKVFNPKYSWAEVQYTSAWPPLLCNSPKMAAMRELLPEPTTPTTITNLPFMAVTEMS